MGKMKEIAIELEEDLMRIAKEKASWREPIRTNKQGYVCSSLQQDKVNHPSHYTFGNYEVLPVLQDWFPKDPLAWQVVKYMSRYKHKGTPLQDLQKAEFYLKELIKNAATRT